MPKRVIDFDAMWGSDKLASCAEWAQAEYAWLYGLADASGCFELTNLRVIWGRVAAIRRNLTIERLEQIFGEFQDKGLLFVWEHEGKRYGHWTGSDVPGRLPPPSWRMRLERLAPPVPKVPFSEYVSRFARGRAALGGGGFRPQTDHEPVYSGFESSDLKFENSPAGVGDARGFRQQRTDPRQTLLTNPKSHLTPGPAEVREHGAPNSSFRPPARGQGAAVGSGTEESAAAAALNSLQGGLEEDQTQDWNWNRNLDGRREGHASRQSAARGEVSDSPAGLPLSDKPLFLNQHTQGQPQTRPNFHDLNSISGNARQEPTVAAPRADAIPPPRAAAAPATPMYRQSEKSLLVARELLVGRGPCGPVKVKPEALERIRAREESRKGSRAP